jgi:hypothetical protein
MEEHLYRILKYRKLVWQPTHASHLSNIFYSFANYPAAMLGGFDKPIETVVENVEKMEDANK